MTQAARHLHAVDGTNHTQVARDIRKGILIVDPTSGELAGDAEATILGLLKIVEKQARENAKLEKRVAEDEDPMNHAKGADIVALFDRWKLGSNHPKAKLGGPRVKLVKARLKDGFDIAGDGTEPDLELAIDGICSYPFQVYDKRNATGRPQDRRDDFELALKDEKHVEALSRLGWKARREGWTPDGGWPREER